MRVMTKEPNPLPTYPNYPLDHPCPNDSRITKIETRVDHLEEHQETFEKKLTDHKESLDKNTLAIEKQVTTWNNLKWMLGIGLTIFGGLFTLLLWELIKIIK